MRLYIKKRPIYIYFLSLFLTSNTLQNIYRNALQSYIFWQLWNMCNVNTYNFYDFLRSKPCFHLLPPNVPLIRYTFIFSISKKVCIAKLYFKQFIISYVQCHFQSSPSPHKCSPNLSILILDLTVSMININISTKIFSVRYVSQVIVPRYSFSQDYYFASWDRKIWWKNEFSYA